MKINSYAYLVNFNDNQSVIFNGINKRFIVIDNKALPSYEAILSNPDTYIESHPIIINELKHIEVLVEDSFDGLEILRKERTNFINSSVYKTSIIPTFECNYNCWYCTQNHMPAIIDEKKMCLIVKHIKKYLIENNIKEYILSWFGGEPLTQPDIIDRMSHELLNFCNENNIDYSAGITTNGALLDENAISVMKRNKINYFQIAIDGDRASHDKNKHDSVNPSSFDLVLGNIVKLAKGIKEANITLRLNFKPDIIVDTHLVDEINFIIPYELRNRMRVDLQRIWQIDERKYDIDKLDALQKKFVTSGYSLTTNHVFSMCYVDKIHYNTIYYNGGVEKCDEKSMDSLRGYINENGDITWIEKPKFMTFDILADNSPCSKCVYYPLCYGSCPIKRDARFDSNGNFKCGLEGDYSKLEHRIKDFCHRVINNKLSKHYSDL